MADRFTQTQLESQQPVLLEILRIIEPELKSLLLLTFGGQTVLHGIVAENRPIPAPLMGEGFYRLVELAVHIANAKDGIVLFDEIENGLHYAILPKLWKSLLQAARRFNVQLFCTTHSRESAVAAHQAFTENGPDEFRLYRLERVDEEIRAVMYDERTLSVAIDANLEIR